MIKVFLFEDDYLSVLGASKSFHTDSWREVILSEEEWQHYLDVEAEYDRLQSRLRELFNDAAPRL